MGKTAEALRNNLKVGSNPILGANLLIKKYLKSSGPELLFLSPRLYLLDWTLNEAQCHLKILGRIFLFFGLGIHIHLSSLFSSLH